MLLSFCMPRRFLRGNYTRLALSVSALALGVALVCAIDLVNRAVLGAFTEIIDSMAGRAALQVTAGAGGLFAEDVAPAVGGVTGVELAVPVVSATTFTADGAGELLTVQGVDVTNDAAVRVYEGCDSDGLKLDDPLLFLNQPDSVILTRVFAARRGLHVGDTIDLDTPTGLRHFTLRALLDAKGIARVHAGNLMVMDLFAAEATFTRPGLVNRIDVVVKRDADLDGVAQAIRAAIPPGLRVEAPLQRKADLQKVMQATQVMLQAVALLGLVGAFLIAFNRLTTVFEQRVAQLAILRAAGVAADAVWRELLKESLLLGAAGVALGIPCGVGLGRLLLPVIATTTALSAKLIAPDAQLSIHVSSVLLAACLGIGAALLAAILPAWRAAHVAIAETIRNRGSEQPESSPRRIWLVRGLCVAASAGAIVMHGATGVPAWGLVASGGIVIATALAARPLLHLLRIIVVPGAIRVAGPTGRMAIGTLVRNPSRSALTIATLGVGLGAVLWLWMVAQSFERSLIDIMPGVLRGDLVVGSAYLNAGFVEAPVDERLVQEIQHLPGVAAVVGEQAIDWEYGDGPIAVEGFDAPYFTEPQFGQWSLVGRYAPDLWTAIVRGESALISTNFALHLGARVGDPVTLDTPSGPLTLRVGGVVSTFLSPRGTIIISRDLYKRMWHDPHVVHALVVTARDADREAVRAEIARRLGRAYGLRVLSLAELIEWFVSQARRAFLAVYLLGATVLLVVVLGVADTLAAGVFERMREIGLLRATGVPRSAVRRMVLAEGLMLGMCGLVLAAVAGLILGTLWVEITFPSVLGWVLELYVPYRQLAMLAAATVLACFGAAVLPGRRAAHLDPAVALRYE